ncbi:hypothetical protein [Nocardia harenae]|uniref:hypothetical protein n=1 Tax=Nocardia harenae TaxID=358707 RepID=UPI000A7EBDF7|nr:hypothetical protein [Nocardia harenae]
MIVQGWADEAEAGYDVARLSKHLIATMDDADPDSIELDIEWPADIAATPSA